MKAHAQLDRVADPYRSNLERSWADQLMQAKAEGLVLHWGYESLSLRIAPAARYTPDFFVLLPDGAIELHEVKGGFVREAARIRLAVAASKFPWFYFCLVRKPPKCDWEVTRVSP